MAKHNMWVAYVLIAESPLTSREIMDRFQILHPAAVIAKLRKYGVVISKKNGNYPFGTRGKKSGMARYEFISRKRRAR